MFRDYLIVYIEKAIAEAFSTESIKEDFRNKKERKVQLLDGYCQVLVFF